MVSALAVQQQQKRAKRLSAVAPSGPPVSMEVMSTNFEEWMKLATDNVCILTRSDLKRLTGRKSQRTIPGILP